MENREAKGTLGVAVSRRTLMGGLGLVGLGITLAGCESGARTAPPAASPASAATKPPAAPASPAPSPAGKPAATASPVAKRVYQPVTVKHAYSTSPTVDTARLVGAKQGFFKDFGVNLEILQVTGTADIIRAMLTNEVTMASADLQAVAINIENGSPMKYLGTYQSKLAHIMFAKPEIKTLKDLEGRSVGIMPVGGLIDNVTRAILRKNGIDESKVEFVPTNGSAGSYQALVVGKIDAAAVADSYAPNAKRDGLVVLLKTWEALPEYVSSGFMATEANLQKSHDEIVRTLAGFAKTFRFLNDPAAKSVWVEVAMSELKQDQEQAEAAWQSVTEAKLFLPDLGITKAQVDFMQQISVEAGKQKAMLPFEKIVDSSVVKEALALL